MLRRVCCAVIFEFLIYSFISGNVGRVVGVNNRKMVCTFDFLVF